MNASVTKPAFTHLLPADSFQAWRVLSDGTSQPLDIIAGDLAEAIQSASVKCQHKDYFTVLHTAASGKRTEHVCYVKQQAARWVRKPGFAHAVQVRPLSADVLFSRAVAAVEPVEPWRWTPGADVVGVDRGEIGGMA
mgnify:CR=1 FL=1